MQEARKRIESEGFSILKLCHDVKNFVDSGRMGRTYLRETEEFLDYIVNSMDAVASSVRYDLEGHISDELVEAKLRDFGEIKKALVWVYAFAKQTIDADSLSIPFSLATFVNHVAEQIQKPSDAKIVVLGSPDLMYYKWNLGELRDLSANISERIKDFPILPNEIGLLLFPYCAAREVLVNCDLFHEMGHYIYETTDLKTEVHSDIVTCLVKFIKVQLMENIKTSRFVARELYNYVRDLLLRWVEEIFADILAIRVLGPAFHFAYLELQQVLPVAIASDADVGTENDFTATHPADNFRFKLHAKWLRKCGWCEEVEKYASEVQAYLEKCEKLEINAFEINCHLPIPELSGQKDLIHKWMLNQVERLVETVEACVSKKLENVCEPFYDYKRSAAGVMTCLEHGVVPSTVYLEGGKIYPNPTTLLNAGFFFFLGGMQGLIERTKSEANPIDRRLHYEKRLNEWLAKAIDDWQILRMEDKL